MPPFTEEDLQSLDTLISERVNKTINGFAATQKKLSEDARKKDREEFAKLVKDELASFKPTTPEPDGGEPGGKGKDGKGRRDDNESAVLRKTVSDLQRAVEESNQRAARERSRNVENTTRQAVFDALSELGLDQARAKGAFAVFKLDDRIEAQVDEESESVSIMFRDDDGTQMPLRDGIKRWSKTESAKPYLPPTNARGSGSRPTTTRGPNGQPLSKEQIETNAMNYLAKALKNEGVVGYSPNTDE